MDQGNAGWDAIAFFKESLRGGKNTAVAKPVARQAPVSTGKRKRGQAKVQQSESDIESFDDDNESVARQSGVESEAEPIDSDEPEEEVEEEIDLTTRSSSRRPTKVSKTESTKSARGGRKTRSTRSSNRSSTPGAWNDRLT